MDKLVAFGFFFLVVLHGGWYGPGPLLDAALQPWPAYLRCADLEAGEAGSGDWVELRSCEPDLMEATVSVGAMHGEARGLQVPVHVRGRRDGPEESEPVVTLRTSWWADAFSQGPEVRQRNLRAASASLDGSPVSASDREALEASADEQQQATRDLQSALATGIDGMLSRSYDGPLVLEHGERPAFWEPLFYTLWMGFGLLGLFTVVTGRSLRIRIPSPRG